MKDSEEPFISVLMPAYNCQAFISQAITSILEQSFENFELLIADDASSDNTWKVISAFSDKRIRLFRNKTNTGYLKTCNFLLEQSSGNFITFQDADDFSEKNRFEKLLENFKTDPSIDLTGSNSYRVSEKNEIISVSDFPLEHHEIVKQMPSDFPFVGAALMLKREVYKKIGGYNTFFDRIGAEDLYWYYLISEKFKVSNIKDPLYYYRENQNSLSGKLENDYRKLISLQLVIYLIIQRKSDGTDDLETRNLKSLNTYYEKLKKPYIENPALQYLQLAKRYFYMGNKKKAIVLQLRGFWKERTFNNLRTLIYYLRNSSKNVV